MGETTINAPLSELDGKIAKEVRDISRLEEMAGQKADISGQLVRINRLFSQEWQAVLALKDPPKEEKLLEKIRKLNLFPKWEIRSGLINSLAIIVAFTKLGHEVTLPSWEEDKFNHVDLIVNLSSKSDQKVALQNKYSDFPAPKVLWPLGPNPQSRQPVLDELRDSVKITQNLRKDADLLTKYAKTRNMTSAFLVISYPDFNPETAKPTDDFVQKLASEIALLSK